MTKKRKEKLTEEFEILALTTVIIRAPSRKEALSIINRCDWTCHPPLDTKDGMYYISKIDFDLIGAYDLETESVVNDLKDEDEEEE